MRVVKSDIRKWVPCEGNRYRSEEGYEIQPKVVEELCKFNGVPATLVSVDKRFKTTTAHTVLSQVLEKEPMFVLSEEGDVLNALNPKSSFMSDDQFEKVVDDVQSLGFKDVKTTKLGASLRATIQLPSDDKNQFFNNDFFEKRVIVERLAEGGMFLNVELLRKVCTNGQLVADAQFKKTLHRVSVDTDLLKTFLADTTEFSISDYFESLWNKNGEPVIASVADYFGMKKTLTAFVGEDMADVVYPSDIITEFYNNQDIDVQSLSRTMQAKLPSGLSYYDAFNFLTHGVKMAEEKDLKLELEVAAWAKPSKLTQLKQSDLIFKGAPYFSPEKILALRGDVK